MAGKFVVVLEADEAEQLIARAVQASTTHDVAVLVERLITAIAGDKRVYEAPPSERSPYALRKRP